MRNYYLTDLSQKIEKKLKEAFKFEKLTNNSEQF